MITKAAVFLKVHFMLCFSHYPLLQFNTSLPLRVMLMCWGPYVLMCIYACFENVKTVSPKLRMVSARFSSNQPQAQAHFTRRSDHI